MNLTPHKWLYEEYSQWGRQIALTNTLQDIIDDLACVDYDTGTASARHLRSIQSTSSMTARSQSRAQARNTMEGLYERRRALRDAIAIYQHHPQNTLEAKD